MGGKRKEEENPEERKGRVESTNLKGKKEKGEESR